MWRSGSSNRCRILNRRWVRDLGLLYFVLIQEKGNKFFNFNFFPDFSNFLLILN